MQIDLILIGDELLKGKVTDLNGPYLSHCLKSMGHSIGRIVIIADDLDSLAVEIASSFHRSDLIITSGGLGPTGDDRTKLALSKALNLPLIEDSNAIEVVKANYARKNREWIPELNQYHRIPKGMIPLNNPVGHAPALKYHLKSTTILALPGVPQEFKSIIDQEIGSLAIPLQNKKTVTFCTREVPEEVLFGTLCPELWSTLEPFGAVSSLPTPGGVILSVECSTQDTNKVSNIILNSKLGPYIWQVGDQSLPEYVFSLLSELGLTVSFAESCTGGLAANLMTNISGSSAVLTGGVVSYSNPVKINSLGVSKSTIATYSEVSVEVAKEMAIGARTILGSDIGISFTGIAGPTGATDTMPVGTVCIGYSTEKTSGAVVHHFKGTRDFLKTKFTMYGYYKILDLIALT
ncbi:MAG: nicotinamide-nucleotide amidohydrolase family protein [Bacteriovoracaceae bacterium]|nr:nicotinamide-nucleotide amidohydrolase family protein [Bacteriovoracaceae bacterium]